MFLALSISNIETSFVWHIIVHFCLKFSLHLILATTKIKSMDVIPDSCLVLFDHPYEGHAKKIFCVTFCGKFALIVYSKDS